MQDHKDHRYADRVNIPEGKIFYRKLEKFFNISRYHGPVQLGDLTKSTISIPSHLPYKKNTPVELKISAPGFSDIYIKGQVYNYEQDYETGMVKTVVQIMPFGSGRSYNSFKTKKKLDQFLSGSAIKPEQ